MSKDKTLYVCSDCGGTSAKWLGKCPQCNAWNTLIESVAQDAGGGNKHRYSAAQFTGLALAQEVTPLSAIEATDIAPPAVWMSWTACWAAASSRAAWC